MDQSIASFVKRAEANKAWRGLQNIIQQMKAQLGYPHLDPAERAVLMDQFAQTSKALDDPK